MQIEELYTIFEFETGPEGGVSEDHIPLSAYAHAADAAQGIQPLEYLGVSCEGREGRGVRCPVGEFLAERTKLALGVFIFIR